VLGVSQSLGSLAQAAGPAAASWLIGRGKIGLFGIFCATFSVAGCLLGIWRERNEALVKQSPSQS
jgi:MFS transporter, DHA1 family, tetracycline resistance protein